MRNLKERIRLSYCKFRGIPPFTAEEMTAKIQKGLADGTLKVEFDHPSAKNCFPSAEPVDFEDRKKGEFTYLKMEVLPPFKPKFWKSYLVKESAHDGGLIFQWGIEGFGFGDAHVVFKQGKWHSDTENLGKDFLKEALCRWVDEMEV